MANAQVFKGKGDTKFQVGANIQEKGTGVIATMIEESELICRLVLPHYIC